MQIVHPPFAARDLRDAFGCYATGVTIVTSQTDSGERVGFTANSFTSVSLDPPLLLVCPATSASALPGLRAAGRFAVNILSPDSQPVADRFAMRGIDRFGEADWLDWEGVPVLASAKAAFACTLHADHDGGDHRIIVGLIRRFGLAPEADSLLYAHGRYRRLDVGP
jgi:flavin reductase (DIM6/NTAB) family NADH-FMN oxidoreductase RutF